MTPKQARFVEEYLLGLNATQAAIEAGYAPGSAHVTASRLLKQAKIRAVIDGRQQERSENTELTIEWVLSQLRETYHAARALKQNAAANQALQLVGKHLGMFSDRLDVRILRERAAEVAAEYDLDANEVAAEAERWLAGKR